MKNIITPLFMLMILAACQLEEPIDMTQLSSEEKTAVESLLWLSKADAAKDAKQSLDRGDKRLLALASRGTNIPGIATDLVSKAKSVCGVRYLPGSTDMVTGETHLKLLQGAEQYAADYNKIVIEQCL